MHGPQVAGFWAGVRSSRDDNTYGVLLPGQRYRVVREFRDVDGDLHPVGESWTYLGYNFSPYYDGLSLFVALEPSGEWHIGMQLDPEAQGPIVAQFSDYVTLDAMAE